MANLFLFLALVLTLIFTVIETVTVRFTYTNEAVIDIDFLFFAILLYPSRNKKKKQRKRGIRDSFKKRFARARAIKKALQFLLKKSELTLEEINLKTEDDDPARFVLKSQAKSTATLLLLTCLSLGIQNFSVEDNIFDLPKRNELYPSPVIDVILKATFFNVMTALLIFLCEVKIKERQDGVIVRK